jgi:hypothetical protein
MGSSWGPSEKLLHDAAQYEFSASWDIPGYNSENSSDDGSGSGKMSEDENEGEFEDGDLLDTAETIALADAYRRSDDPSSHLDVDNFSATGSAFRSISTSRKRPHVIISQ